MPYFRRETPGAASYDAPDMRPIVVPGVQVVRGRRVRGIPSRGPLSEVEQRVAPRAFGSRMLGGPRSALGAVNMNTLEAQAIKGRTLPVGSPGGTGQPSNVRFGAAAVTPVAAKRGVGKGSTTLVATGPVYPSGDTFNTSTRGPGTGTGSPGGSPTTTACYARGGCAPQPQTKPPQPGKTSTPDPNLQIGTGIGSPNPPLQSGNYLTGPVYPLDSAPIQFDTSFGTQVPSMLDNLIAAATPYKTPLLLGGAALAAYYLLRK